jgi:hypothetical protein
MTESNYRLLLKFVETKMKKIIFLLVLFLLLFPAALFAQSTILGLNGGMLFPEDTESGAIIGLSWGQMLDQNISWEIEGDYFWRTYTEEMTVEVSGGTTQSSTIVTEIENSTRMLPLFFKVSYLTQILPKLDLKLGGGLGYLFLWNNDTNYKLDVESSESYSGFAWQLSAGISFPISRAADFYGEGAYLFSSPSTDAGTTPDGLPKRTEVDMSGIWLRLGLRLYH